MLTECHNRLSVRTIYAQLTRMDRWGILAGCLGTAFDQSRRVMRTLPRSLRVEEQGGRNDND
jgi:hypothetical protein